MATVTFDGIPATNVVVVSPTEITCTTPVHIVDPVPVTVTNPDTQTATLVNGYTYVIVYTSRQVVGGNWQDALANPISGGSITFQLNTDGQAGTTQVMAGRVTSATLDSNGSVAASPIINLWPNDQPERHSLPYQGVHIRGTACVGK